MLTGNNYGGMDGNARAEHAISAATATPRPIKLAIRGLGGTATGSTGADRVHNAGGPGAWRRLANGISGGECGRSKGGTTAPGAFALGARRGPRRLRSTSDLFRGGLTGSSPSGWFLRSSFIVPPEPPVLPVEPPIPPLPIDPPPQPLPPGVYPIIGPELATDGVVQPIARQMAVSMLGTLHERIGDTLTLANTGG